MELMGVLLLRANETVPLDQIVEGVWGSRPPKSAIRNVRTYAWQLRNDLGDEAHRLSGSPGGYRISCAEGELDLSIFQKLAEEGLLAAKSGKDELATERLEEALSHWRGNPFGGTPLSHYLQEEVDWLCERRLSIFEELISVFLKRGMHYKVIERAGREIIRYPLREGLHEKLMKSLVLSGRHGEAIAAYRKVERIFDAELGVEPNIVLKELYHEVLSGSVHA